MKRSAAGLRFFFQENGKDDSPKDSPVPGTSFSKPKKKIGRFHCRSSGLSHSCLVGSNRWEVLFRLLISGIQEKPSVQFRSSDWIHFLFSECIRQQTEFLLCLALFPICLIPFVDRTLFRCAYCLRLVSLRWQNERRTDFVSGDFFVGPAGIAGMSKILCKFVFW